MEKLIKPIAYIHNDFKEKFGIPRQSGRVPSLESTIIFEKEFSNPDSLRVIENFSYLWLLFDFSKNEYTEFSPTVRPPRLGGNKKVGVFASRSPFRPNGIGLSSVKLLDVKDTEKYGKVLIVGGADLLDGTPIYDIKPYIPSSDCHLEAKGGYSDEFTNYKLKVVFPENLLNIIPKEKQTALIGCLEEDPRPSYKDDSNEYGMKFDRFNVKFSVKKDMLTVLSVE